MNTYWSVSEDSTPKMWPSSRVGQSYRYIYAPAQLATLNGGGKLAAEIVSKQ